MSVLINGPQVNRSAWTKCILIMCTVYSACLQNSFNDTWLDLSIFCFDKDALCIEFEMSDILYKVLTIQGGQTKIPLNFLKIMIFYRTKIQNYLLPVRRNFILNVNTLWKIASIELGLICDVKMHILVYL